MPLEALMLEEITVLQKPEDSMPTRYINHYNDCSFAS